MNIVSDVKIKKVISDFDLANVIETIVSFAIRKDDFGEVKYTPYYKNYGCIVGIVRYLLDGIEFDKDDDLFEIYCNNDSIHEVVHNYMKDNHDDMKFIYEHANDKIEFEKQRHINDISELKERLLKSIEQEQALNELNIKLAKKQNDILSQQIKSVEFNNQIMEYMKPEEIAELNKKVASGEYNMEKIAEIITDKYLHSTLHKENVKAVKTTKKRQER